MQRVTVRNATASTPLDMALCLCIIRGRTGAQCRAVRVRSCDAAMALIRKFRCSYMKIKLKVLEMCELCGCDFKLKLFRIQFDLGYPAITQSQTRSQTQTQRLSDLSGNL